VDDLRRHYHQIVYATGNESDRRLGIPGEGIPRSTPATVFVGWYNGHPDYRRAELDFSVRRVAIIGNGNVAVDVARMLLRTPAELERTDVAPYALEALRQSRVREVFMIGRRGPAQAAFSPAELEELGKLDSADPIVDPADLAGLDAPEASQNLAILRAFAARRPRPDTRRLHFLFLRSPVEVLADPAGGVAGLALERNRLEARADGTLAARGTGERERLEMGMVLPAVGYAADPIPGVPFDAKARTIANDDGRVVDPATRARVPNEYVVGWARSGAQGLIGEHKKASAQVVAHAIEDAPGGEARPLPPRDAVDALLRERGVRVVTFDDWRRLDEIEVARGARRGAPREKFSEVEAILKVLGK